MLGEVENSGGKAVRWRGGDSRTDGFRARRLCVWAATHNCARVHNCATRLPGRERVPTDRRDDYDESYLERKAQRRPLLTLGTPTFDIDDVSFAL